MKSKVILSFILVFLYACQETFLPPLIFTGLVSDIDQEGAVFHAKITSLGNREIKAFGFVWDTIPFPTIESAYSYKFHQQAELGNFQAKVSSALIRNKIYYVRAFIQNTETTTYGEEVSFVSMGGKEPEITGIEPLVGNINDTLVVIGKYFGTKNPVVRINRIKAKVVQVSQDSIHVIIPSDLKQKTSELTLENLNQFLTAKDSFTLISPEFHDFVSKTGTYGDEVTIIGKNFAEMRASLQVHFHETPAEFEFIDDHTIKAIVPDRLDTAVCSISITMNNQKVKSGQYFSLAPVEIEDFNPKVILTGKTLVITGRNFNPFADKNKVYIGGVLAKTLSVTGTTLTVSLPYQENVLYESRNSSVQVNVGGNIRTFEEKLLINDKWFRLADAPLELRNEYKICATCPSSYDYNYAHSFAVGKTAYIGLNSKQSFWAYDTEKNTWRKLADFPGKPRRYAVGVVYGTKIYFGTGQDVTNTAYPELSDWWEYDTETDTWTQKAYFIGVQRSYLRAYSVTNACFLSSGFSWSAYSGYTFNLFKYNPLMNEWTRENANTENIDKMDRWMITKTVNNEVFMGYLETFNTRTFKFFIFNPVLKVFAPIASFPYYVISQPNSMILNNTLYVHVNVGGDTSRSFMYYDRSVNAWKSSETRIYTDIRYGVSFEAGNVGYAGLGTLNHLYEFDPNR